MPLYKNVNGVQIEMSAAEEAAMTTEWAANDAAKAAYEAAFGYQDRRKKEYPPLADQLDMLYHDMKDGTSTWVAALDAVKTKYPKPV